jgi:glycosyltransferase involved in cell wall biosynthesis
MMAIPASSAISLTDPIPTLKQVPPLVSVVMPITDQRADLVKLYHAYAGILRREKRPFEFVFVIDGGSKESTRTLEPLQNAGEPIQVVVLPKPFGEATTLSVGFEHALGEFLLVIPPQFQVMPEGIQEILKRLDEGFDLVTTRRYPRLDSWINRLQDNALTLLTRWFTGVRLNDIGCRLKGMRRRVIREIDLYGDLHRFLPLLAYRRGFRSSEVSVPQHPFDARTKIARPTAYLQRILDLLTIAFLLNFIKKPLRFFGLVGIGLFGAGSLIVGTLVLERIAGMAALTDRPLLILGVLLMVLGVQVGSIGLLGELIVFTHAKKLRDYAIERFLK